MKKENGAPSFSRTAKERICATVPRSACCRRELLRGYLSYCRRGSDGGAIIKDGSEQIMKRIYGLLSEFSGFEKQKDFVPQSLRLGREELEKLSSPDPLQTGCENCKRYFLCGAFIAVGTAVDPEKGSRIELVFPKKEGMLLCEEILKSFSVFPLKTERNGKYVLYLKAGESVEDFLGLIGAQTSAFEFMNARIEKEIRNNANRVVNCDSHNISRSTGAGKLQADAAAYLESTGLLSSLPDELKETARLRMQNPELPLAELALMHEPAISKSGLNHRLRKLTEKAEEEKRKRAGD